MHKIYSNSFAQRLNKAIKETKNTNIHIDELAKTLFLNINQCTNNQEREQIYEQSGNLLTQIIGYTGQQFFFLLKNKIKLIIARLQIIINYLENRKHKEQCVEIFQWKCGHTSIQSRKENSKDYFGFYNNTTAQSSCTSNSKENDMGIWLTEKQANILSVVQYWDYLFGQHAGQQNNINIKNIQQYKSRPELEQISAFMDNTFIPQNIKTQQLENFQKRIKQTMGIEITKKNTFSKRPINKYRIPCGGNNDCYFGLHYRQINTAMEQIRNNPPEMNALSKNNCAGTVQQIIKQAGADLFGDTKELQTLWVPNPQKFPEVMLKINQKIAELNEMCKKLQENTNHQDDNFKNMAKEHITDNPKINVLITKYKNQPQDTTNNKKISLLIKITEQYSKIEKPNKSFVTSLLKEIKKNYGQEYH